jgi:hypothetical protein
MSVVNPYTTADKQRELELLSESDIDWTLVRLPLIELTDKKSEWRVENPHGLPPFRHQILKLI